ncbi:lipopolysaccharide biosynthesis protein [Pedobacter sp. SL55]|uniref:lipopolysaccharide biosynthesis protein n=1 Tax=Pedobacter sp. SL55 TaxID=2995161 RepID=UPI0022719155|nr:hypothetical protein [Pedobacter sp. SL55]WAC40321.1 hypothetical protein OVA16_17370 [Pedobacter sp. SL55]
MIKKTLGICNILKVILQILSVFTFGANLYLFLALEVIFAIVTSIALNHLIKKTYPWLEILKENDFKYKKELLKNAKQIFSHRLGSFILTQTDQLLIYAYTSLKMVTFYNNYLMIVQFAVTLTNQPFLSLHSAIGNLVVTNSREKSYRVFQELLLLKYWLAGNVIFVLYATLNPFIALWLDKSYILDHNIIIILLLNFFINIVRKPLDIFLQAFGIFHDTWAPFTEAGLNLVSSVILGYFYGIFGILLGSFISTLLIVCIWKPYLLFSKGFNLPVLFYFKKTLKYLLFYFFAAITAFYSTPNILQHIHSINKYIQFAISLCAYSMLFATLYSLLFILFANESKPLVKRFNALIKSA